MKNLIILLLSFFFILSTSFAQNGVFIEYKISAGDGKQSMIGNNKTYTLNGNSRHEMNLSVPGLPVGAMNTITLTLKDKPNTIIKLNPSNKTYTEMTFEDEEPEYKKNNEPFEVTVVGKETVNGYSSTHVIAKFKNSGKTRNEWWTSNDVAGFPGFKGMKGSKYMDDDNFFSKLAEKGADGFPVRMKMSETGAGAFQMDLVKAEKKNLESSLFEIPAGYTKGSTINMNNMPKSMEEMKNMTPEEQQKMIQDLMKMYGGQQAPPQQP